MCLVTLAELESNAIRDPDLASIIARTPGLQNAFESEHPSSLVRLDGLLLLAYAMSRAKLSLAANPILLSRLQSMYDMLQSSV